MFLTLVVRVGYINYSSYGILKFSGRQLASLGLKGLSSTDTLKI